MRTPTMLCYVAAILAAPAIAKETGRDVEVRVGAPLARAALLKPGTQRYLRYLVKDGHRTAIDIWSRTVSFETRDGRRLVRVAQLWDGAGPNGSVRREDSLMEAGTMRPIEQVRTIVRDGVTKTAAYRFDGARVTGIADRAGNDARDFAIAGSEPLFNFVPDSEWFQQLPMAAGISFVASLYDPGSGKPDRYRFTIAGAARIAGPDGKPVDCWLMTTDYNAPEHGLTRMWFAKRTQVMIRQEGDAGPRGHFVKTLLPPEAGD
ncbi:hypothetical protein [Sphingomonas taxi]|nr:hypothetical protein [Sphingomonas taxi]